MNSLTGGKTQSLAQVGFAAETNVIIDAQLRNTGLTDGYRGVEKWP